MIYIYLWVLGALVLVFTAVSIFSLIILSKVLEQQDKILYFQLETLEHVMDKKIERLME